MKITSLCREESIILYWFPHRPHICWPSSHQYMHLNSFLWFTQRRIHVALFSIPSIADRGAFTVSSHRCLHMKENGSLKFFKAVSGRVAPPLTFRRKVGVQTLSQKRTWGKILLAAWATDTTENPGGGILSCRNPTMTVHKFSTARGASPIGSLLEPWQTRYRQSSGSPVSGD